MGGQINNQDVVGTVCNDKLPNSKARILNFRRVHFNKNGKIKRKEVIQPLLPERLPCYDLSFIADPGLIPTGTPELRPLPTLLP